MMIYLCERLIVMIDIMCVLMIFVDEIRESMYFEFDDKC